MTRLTTTFQGMEFIKILLEALGRNIFSLVEGTAASVAGRKAQEHQSNRDCRDRCIITNYSIRSPAPAPETVSGLGKNASQQTSDKWEKGSQVPLLPTGPHRHLPRYSKWGAAGLQSRLWLLAWQGYRAGFGSTGTSHVHQCCAS